jgi:hypothetical protein
MTPNDTELIEISNPLDQPIPLELGLLSQIDTIISQAISEENVSVALEAAKKSLSLTRISGLALAKLLYKIKINWSKFYIDDDYLDYMHNELGLIGITITRYCRVWEMFESHIIPSELEEKMLSKPMRDLVAVSNTVTQEYDIDDKTWDALANSPDSSTLNETLRTLKNVEPRSNALLIRIKRNGDITAYKDGGQFFCGYLELESDEPAVKAAIDRILSASGILRE